MPAHQQLTSYNVGDRVIINTRNLKSRQMHPPSGETSLFITESMYGASGQPAEVIWREEFPPNGYLYRLNVTPGYFYSSKMLIPAQAMNNLQASLALDKNL